MCGDSSIKIKEHLFILTVFSKRFKPFLFHVSVKKDQNNMKTLVIIHKDPYDGDKADSELVVCSPLRSCFTWNAY